MNYVFLVGVGAMLFAATDIDDLMFLMAFLADPEYRARNVAIGQFAGILTILGVSLAASLISMVISPALVGLLGLLPMLIGARKLLALRRRSEAGEETVAAADGSFTQTFAVFSTTIATGGDNLSANIPVFAMQTPDQRLAVVAGMLIMTGVWLGIAYWLVNHRTIGAPIRKYGPRVVPFVLIALGAYIVYRAGAIPAIWSWSKG